MYAGDGAGAMGGKTLSGEPGRGSDADRTAGADALGRAASLAGIASSVATVAGTAQTLRSGDWLWVLSGGGTAVFLVYAAWRRHRVAMAASMLLLAVVALGGFLARSRVPAQASGTPPLAGGTAPVASTAGDSAVGSAGATSAGTPAMRTVEVTLPRHAAADVDPAGPPVVAGGQSGPTGSFDLYHDAGEVMADDIRTPDGMYGYPAATSPDSAYAICSDYTSPDPSHNAYQTDIGLYTGESFCFRTTGGKLAWATIEAVQPGTSTVVLQVRIWQ